VVEGNVRSLLMQSHDVIGNFYTMTRPPFIAENERSVGHTHVLLITTGSVASIKAPLIVSELLKVGFLSPPLTN
jgi:hypothetical protein